MTAAAGQSLQLAFEFAKREMRGGLRGFYIFLGCIALGVAAIAGVNSVATAISEGIRAEGRAILGGDIEFALVQRLADAEELDFFTSHGSVAYSATMRAMARTGDASDQTLVELKAVEDAYPLHGELKLSESKVGSSDLGASTLFADPLLLDRLGLKIGDTIQVGSADFQIRATILSEPDKVGDGIGFGPRVIMSHEGLARTELVKPGSLVRNHYKLVLSPETTATPAELANTARERFPDSGWRIRTSSNAAPALTRNVERFSQFLTLVALTSLIVGGVGVANATRAFLEVKRPVIATLKSVGASGSFIFRLYLMQILIMATIGVIIGLGIGITLPFLTRSALSGLLPVSSGTLFFPTALLPAIAFGYLTALAFAIWPLAVSRDVQPTDLFRAASWAGSGKWPAWKYVMSLAILVGLLVGLAILMSDNRQIAITFIAATGAAFLLLRVVALAIQWMARNFPSVSSTPLRMAVANIHRPGSLTGSVVLSLGLGLALLVALATIDGNLRNQIANNLPEQAPDFFFVDIQSHEIEGFRSQLDTLSPGGKIISVPMLRGRVTALKGTPAQEFKPVRPGSDWVLRGDRGITYAINLPENSTLGSGEWWKEGYDGPPLVSVTQEEATDLGLKVGDLLQFNVLGRTIEARIANLRNVEWERLGINFVFVFSPNTFAGAPHAYMATLLGKNRDGSDDANILKSLASTFPTVTAVRVRDALNIVNTLVSQLSNAIRAAAVVALLSSVLVLAGALAAGNRERVHDAVVLKTLGATRATLMRTLITEYSILGFATAVFALLAGSLAAWFVISVIMELEFAIMPEIAIATVLAALALTILLGLAGTWHILGQKAAPILREL